MTQPVALPTPYDAKLQFKRIRDSMAMGDVQIAFQLADEASQKCPEVSPMQFIDRNERAAFEAWAKIEWQNSSPPSSAWIGWIGRALHYFEAPR